MLRNIIKKGIIEETDICYSNMYELSKSIDSLKERFNYEYRVNKFYEKTLKSQVRKPSTPIFFDIYYFAKIFEKYSFFEAINKKKREYFKSYLIKYDLYIDSLEAYIEKNISLGYISYSLLLDLDEIVKYKMKHGYSLASYFRITTIFKELSYGLMDY